MGGTWVGGILGQMLESERERDSERRRGVEFGGEIVE
jgi:hypothetical protein